jgi:hypothetical protein
MKAKWLVVLLAALIGLNATAKPSFKMPSEAQKTAAAADPSLLAPLLRGASVPEAAQVVRGVIIQVVKLADEPARRDARIRSVIREAFRAMPGQAAALAAALGEAMAGSPSASRDPAVVSSIQKAMIAIAGREVSDGVDIASTFGNAYALALQTVGSAPGIGKTSVANPPPPPVSSPYDGQMLI